MKKVILNLQKNLQILKKQVLKTKIYLTTSVFLISIQAAVAETVANKSESSVVLQKFGIAILLVGFFALALYLLLYLYKKFISSKSQPQIQYPQPNSLKSAKNMNEAIQIFLEKTKPHQ